MTNDQTTEPTEPADGVVALAGIDWWYHNRGHSEAQVMQRLAKNHKVLWVNSIGMRMPTPGGGSDIPWTRYLRKAKSLLQGMRKDKDTGMWVLSPFFIPRYSPVWMDRNAKLVGAQVRLACRFLKIRRPATWITLPTVAGTVENGDWVRSVFNRCDEFSAFADADTEAFEALEERLIRACDSVLYVSEPLMEREAALCNHAEFLGHGVDFDRFSGARTAGTAASPLPAELADATTPIVGFYGAMDDFRMDKELMVATARHIAPATLALVGPAQMDLSTILEEPNVIHVPQVPHTELPRLAAAFDVGIIPFLQNGFNESSNPIKLKEYLALGFPVVATRIPAYTPYADLMHLADGHDEFLAQLDLALAEAASGDDEAAELRRKAVEADSWDNQTARVAELLGLG